MRIYFDIVGFSFLRFFSYPFEILAAAGKRLVELFFLIFFWSLVIQHTNQQITLSQISSYLFISMGISDLVMAKWGPLGSLIGTMNKTGQLSNYIIKPIELIPTLYSIAFGRSGMRIFLAVINVIIGMLIAPPQSIVSLLLFLSFLLCSWYICLAYNIFEGILFLHFTEASAIKNAFYHFVRVLSGSIVPLYLFPENMRNIIRFTPFPSMVYAPAHALSINSLSSDVLLDISVAIFWAFALSFTMMFLWNYSMKKYEAVGI
jgi:ABC-2 type transport system permease protein